MGRGVSSGGGQSSLGYLFGSGEAPKPGTNSVRAAESAGSVVNNVPSSKPAAASQPVDVTKQIPAGINSSSANNYMRADGQNTGNFITIVGKYEFVNHRGGVEGIFQSQHTATDRPSTKVHAAPGGGSSLGYLFGGGSN